MRKAKTKVYYLHNIGGRRCGMIATTSKDQVRAIVRLPPSEIAEGIGSEADKALALSRPGILFTRPITNFDAPWQPEPQRGQPSPSEAPPAPPAAPPGDPLAALKARLAEAQARGESEMLALPIREIAWLVAAMGRLRDNFIAECTAIGITEEDAAEALAEVEAGEGGA